MLNGHFSAVGFLLCVLGPELLRVQEEPLVSQIGLSGGGRHALTETSCQGRQPRFENATQLGFLC